MLTIQSTPCRASWCAVLLLLSLSCSVAASESTLARLSFWVPPEGMEEFEAAYEEQVVPILKKHGLVASSRRGRATVDSVFSRLFAFETPAAVASINQILQKDPAWQGALVQLGSLFDETAPGAPIRFEFELYQAAAGPGRHGAGRGHRCAGLGRDQHGCGGPGGVGCVSRRVA